MRHFFVREKNGKFRMKNCIFSFFFDTFFSIGDFYAPPTTRKREKRERKKEREREREREKRREREKTDMFFVTEAGGT